MSSTEAPSGTRNFWVAVKYSRAEGDVLPARARHRHRADRHVDGAVHDERRPSGPGPRGPCRSRRRRWPPRGCRRRSRGPARPRTPRSRRSSCRGRRNPSVVSSTPTRSSPRSRIVGRQVVGQRHRGVGPVAPGGEALVVARLACRREPSMSWRGPPWSSSAPVPAAARRGCRAHRTAAPTSCTRRARRRATSGPRLIGTPDVVATTRRGPARRRGRDRRRRRRRPRSVCRARAAAAQRFDDAAAVSTVSSRARSSSWAAVT